MEKRFYTVRESAEFLNCHVNSIYTRVRSGSIKSRRIGKKILIDRDTLESFGMVTNEKN